MVKTEAYALVGSTAMTVNEGSWGPDVAGRPWSPGFWTQLPWTGLLALLLGAGCGTAALVVALVSDAKSLDHWTVGTYAVQPPVIVAVLVTLANVALSYAFTSGIAIFWWTSALAGRTLGHLHASQSQGASLMGLFQRRPVINKMLAASVLMMLLLVDQPLFQRGIRVTNRSQQRLENSTLPISSSPLQWGATGILTPQATRPGLYHPIFAGVVRQFQAREPIKLDGFSCNGQCDADIVAAGWDITCVESSRQHIVVKEGKDRATSSLSALPGPEHIQTVFNVSLAFPEWPARSSGSHYINASTLYKATPGENGTLERRRECMLSEALVRYPVEITGNTLNLRSMSGEANRTVKIVSRAPELPGQANYPSTLGGLWLALHGQYRAQVELYSTVHSSVAIYTNDTISNAYLKSSSDDPNELASYNTTWADPMDDIIVTAHELMLRTAIATTGRTSWPQAGEQTNTQSAPGYPHVNHTLYQEVKVTRSFTEPVYEMQPGWLAGAFAVIGLACLSIIPTYWGWWHLGRPVSLNVLEVAKAFDAPLLQQADPNGSIDEHLRAVGNTRIQYAFHTQDVPQENIGNHKSRSSCLDADPDSDLDAVSGNRSASPQGQAGAGHGNVSPMLSGTATDGRNSGSSNEQVRVQSQSVSSATLEMATDDEQGDTGKGRGENDIEQSSTTTTADDAPETNDSSVHQTPGEGVESHGIGPRLMFREVDSYQ